MQLYLKWDSDMVSFCEFEKFCSLQRTPFLKSTSERLLLYHESSSLDELKKLPVFDDSEFNKLMSLSTLNRISLPKWISQMVFPVLLMFYIAFLQFSRVIFASYSSTNFWTMVFLKSGVFPCYIHMIWKNQFYWVQLRISDLKL